MKHKPGSLPAYRAGCLCSIVDNQGGLGLYGDAVTYGYSVDTACPWHGEEVRANLLPGYVSPGLPEPQRPEPRRPQARPGGWKPWMDRTPRAWEDR